MLIEFTISSDLASARYAQDLLEEALSGFPSLKHDVFSLKLALEESLVDAIRHGNRCDPDKRLFFVYRVTPERLQIRITDEGSGTTRTLSWPQPG
jgi:serine/threonine-protein kinase RsbW